MIKLSLPLAFLFAMTPIASARAADVVVDPQTENELYRAIVDEGVVTLHLRSYFFDRENAEAPDNEAWAGGGWLGYETGWIGDVLKVGAIGYTSQPIWAPEDKDGTLLLKPGQEGYTVLGQAYAALKYEEQILTFYRQSVNQPEVNPQDNRMTPNTFEGITLGGALGDVGYFAGYLTQMKKRNADEFVDFAQAAGASGEDQQMWLGGVTYAPTDELKTRASTYLVPDILASGYTDAVWTHPVGEETSVRLSGQFMYQGSVGDDQLTGDSFDTWVGGVKGDLIYGGLTLTTGFTQTSDEYNWQAPYGSWPGYSSMIWKDFDRAGEWAVIAGAAFDFSSVGVSGLSVTALAAFGGGAEDPSTGENLSDNTEYDFTVDYRFKDLDGEWAWLAPLWLRARAVRLLEDEDGDTSVSHDYRIIANYEWLFGGKN